MLLNEILDKDVDYKVVVDDSDYFETHATINDREIIFMAELRKRKESHWEVYFGQPKFSHKTLQTRIDYSMTGGGNELEVFAMVKKSIMELIKKHNPKVIKFEGAKEGGKDNTTRISLYHRLLKRFNLPNYEISSEPHPEGDAEIFTITRKD